MIFNPILYFIDLNFQFLSIILFILQRIIKIQERTQVIFLILIDFQQFRFETQKFFKRFSFLSRLKIIVNNRLIIFILLRVYLFQDLITQRFNIIVFFPQIIIPFNPGN